MSPKLMYCFLSGARALLPTPYRRSSFPASCAPRYSVYATCVSLCCAKICSHWTALTPAARAVAAFSTWIGWCRVYPNWVSNDDAVLLPGYDAGEVPVSLPLGKMGGLHDGESPTEFVLESVNWFGSYYPPNLHYGIFLGDKYFVPSIFGNFDDILASTLLEREDVWCWNCEDELISAKPMSFTEVDEKDIS